MVVLNEYDKENIKNMSSEATKYCGFPMDLNDIEKIKEFVNTE